MDQAQATRRRARWMGAANPDEVVETPDASSLRPVTRFNLGVDLETVGRADPTSGNATAERNESPPTHPPTEVPQMERLANHAANQLAAAEGHVEYEMDLAVRDTTLRITFMIYEQGRWRPYDHLTVTPAEPAAVEQLVRKYARNRHTIFYDKDLRPLLAEQCFWAATEDGTNTIFMALDGRLHTTWQLVASAAEVVFVESPDAEPSNKRRK
jgi:hypothetical protein